MSWRALPAGAVLLAVAAVGCSSDAGVGVRTDGTVASAEIDVVTDGSTTTLADAPSATATPATASGDDDDLTGPSRPQPAAEPAPLVPVPDVVAAGAPLGTALLAEGPTGWTSASEDAPGLGALTVAEAAGALGDPEAELALLTTRRLRGAHARRWTGPEGSRATVVAYQFADEEGALAYEVDSFLSLVAAGATESVGAVRSRAFEAVVAGEQIDGRSLRRGDRLYLVVVRGGPPGLADALVGAQAARLAS